MSKPHPEKAKKATEPSEKPLNKQNGAELLRTIAAGSPREQAAALLRLRRLAPRTAHGGSKIKAIRTREKGKASKKPT